MHKLIRSMPFVRGFTYKSSPYHVGSIVENRLGLQLFRTISKYTLRKIRRNYITDQIRDYIHRLEEDGVVLIENFLTEEDFAGVLREFEKANENIQPSPYKGDKNARLYRTQIPVSESAQYALTTKLIRDSELLNEIAAAVIKRKILKRPDVLLDTYQNLNSEGFDNDIENILHADLHTSTVKMFYYLNEVDENNGAFIYAKGSHRLSVERLKYEYEFSIRQAKMKKGLKISDSLKSTRGGEVRNIITPSQLQKMDVIETQICVKPNTLVIANNMGFHRRGEFSSAKPRKALLINFRNSERSVW